MGMVNKFFYMIVLAGLMSFLPLKTYAGEDVVRAGLFLDYAKKAKKALKSVLVFTTDYYSIFYR